MPQFTPTRALLNPQFEGYRLSFMPSPNLQYVSLSQRATQSRSGINARGFQEVASRVRHNHLAVGDNSAIYVAEDGSIILMRLSEDGPHPWDEQGGLSLHSVFQLPDFVSDSARVQAEYPAAAYLCQDTWLVSDGHGAASLLRIPNGRSTAKMLASWVLLTDNTTVPSPFQLHSAAVIEPQSAIAIISSSYIPSPSAVKGKHIFDIWAVRVPLPDPDFDPLDPVPSPAPFEIIWRRQGRHIPLFATYSPAREAFLLIGGSSYFDTTIPLVPPYEPSPDELAPIPCAGENLATTSPIPVPPYSWTQTDDSVTLAFALPGLTPKTSIHATFERGTMSLRAGSPPLPQTLYAGAPLWDMIHPTSSLWTWEHGSATNAGLLTVHLDKAHPGTRWSHVFAQGFEAHETAEALDPSELAVIRDTLDKYTASLQDGASGLGHGIPSLAQGERDDEVDSSVGHSVLLTWVANDGSASGSRDDTPAALLSIPLPGVKNTLSLIIKNDIDGPLYTLDDTGTEWKHAATYPALGFVLASKRDTRFTFHISSSAVLAFESGARNNGGGNVYIYRGGKPGDKWAKQGVFQQQHGAGTLLGVGAITSKAGQQVLLCLSERQLTICHDLF